MSSERLHLALERLREAWLTLGVPIAEHLADPLSPSDATAALADVGLEAPEELTAWFSWHDGHNYPCRHRPDTDTLWDRRVRADANAGLSP
jgi:hypothetical protein